MPKQWLILHAIKTQYFAGLQAGKLTWTDDPANAYTFPSKLDAGQTAIILRRRNGHTPANALLIVPADRATLNAES